MNYFLKLLENIWYMVTLQNRVAIYYNNREHYKIKRKDLLKIKRKKLIEIMNQQENTDINFSNYSVLKIRVGYNNSKFHFIGSNKRKFNQVIQINNVGLITSQTGLIMSILGTDLKKGSYYLFSQSDAIKLDY